MPSILHDPEKVAATFVGSVFAAIEIAGYIIKKIRERNRLEEESKIPPIQVPQMSSDEVTRRINSLESESTEAKIARLEWQISTLRMNLHMEQDEHERTTSALKLSRGREEALKREKDLLQADINQLLGVRPESNCQ